MNAARPNSSQSARRMKQELTGLRAVLNDVAHLHAKLAEVTMALRQSQVPPVVTRDIPKPSIVSHQFTKTLQEGRHQSSMDKIILMKKGHDGELASI